MLRLLYFGVSEQAKAGKHRLGDARALFDAGRWRGAMYMAGYSVECLLKTKLMLKFKCRHLLELDAELQRLGTLSTHATVFTHQLEALIRISGTHDRLRQNSVQWRQFTTVNRWVPAWRYTADQSSEENAKNFMVAVEGLSNWIENNT